MHDSARFWDRTAKRYARQPIADAAAYRKKLEITRGYLRPDTELFEFGCGSGSTAIAHAPYVNHVLAIDISANMLAIARTRAAGAGVRNIAFRQAGIETFDAAGATFDVVLGLSILHLLDGLDAATAKAHALLKPRGVFISSTACLGDSAWKHIKYIAPFGRLIGLMPPVTVFTTDELRRSHLEAGFAIEHLWQPGKGKAVFIVARKSG